jgi:alpha-beta hydrolase superfamily lysophospholipase
MPAYSPYCRADGIVPARPAAWPRGWPPAWPSAWPPPPAVREPDLSDPTLDTITAGDGTRLARRLWSPRHEDPRGTVLIVHGLGEHGGRYGHVAAWLVARGWRVSAYDHRGHGASEGARGRLRRSDDLLTDLAVLVDAERAGSPGPLVLLGHSMGGLVAARFVADAVRPVDALVLTSPALDPGLSAFQRLQLRLARTLAPDLAMSSGLDSAFLSHDPAVVREYDSDPLVHDRVTGRLVGFIAESAGHVHARAAAWTVPTLLLWAGDDHIVAPAGSAAFAAEAPRAVVEAHRFDALWHEILNERAAGPVYAVLERWLAARFPATGR